MEATSIVILTSAAFMLVIMSITALIIFSAQRKKHKFKVELHELEVARQKEISINTLKTQESERRHIGLEIHDELGPAFSIVKMNLSRIQQKLKNGDELSASELADTSAKELEKAIGKFSNLSKLLYPVILTRYGLQKAIEDIIARSFEQTEHQIEAEIEEIRTDSELMTLSIYRVFQELINNTLKHADATVVQLKLHDDDQNIHMFYKDNGKGFVRYKTKAGLGMNSISGRVAAIGGSLDMQTAPGQGITVNISIPHEK